MDQALPALQAAADSDQGHGSLSGPAELATAALLLRYLVMPQYAAQHKKSFGRPLDPADRTALMQGMEAARKLWNGKYAPSAPHVSDDAWEDTFSWDGRIRVAASPQVSNKFTRRNGEPQVAINTSADLSSLAHEMGHAEMFATGHGLNGVSPDFMGRLQEAKIRGIAPTQTLAKGNTSRGWRGALAPAVGAVAGIGAGALAGDAGPIVGGIVGAATGLPLLAVELEAWRRGAEYAKAMGIGRGRYAARAILPLLSYASIPAANAALGIAAGELAKDAAQGNLG